MLRATVSGSFHRHLEAISTAVGTLLEMHVQVLSPADPRVVDAKDEFLFVASDRVRSIRLVQDRHLESIRASDFLWLVTPDGYVGQSAAMELGFAVSEGTPIFATTLPSDLTLRQYVHRVQGMGEALHLVQAAPRAKPLSFLIDPHESIELAHAKLAKMAALLRRAPSRIREEAAREIERERRAIGQILHS